MPFSNAKVKLYKESWRAIEIIKEKGDSLWRFGMEVKAHPGGGVGVVELDDVVEYVELDGWMGVFLDPIFFSDVGFL